MLTAISRLEVLRLGRPIEVRHIDASPRIEALQHLVGERESLAELWGRRFGRWSSPSVLSLLPNIDDVQELLGSGALRPADFRLVRDGGQLRASESIVTRRPRPKQAGGELQDLVDLAVDGTCDRFAVERAIRSGASVVVQSVHRYLASVGEFCADLSCTLGHATHANFYFTPAGARALDRHTDAHDVFVVQLDGTKEWHVENDSFFLVAGDVLYMPEGAEHAAACSDSHSLHLTIGCKAWTVADVLRHAIDATLGTEEMRRRLPIAWFESDANVLHDLQAGVDKTALSAQDLHAVTALHEWLSTWYRGQGSPPGPCQLRDGAAHLSPDTVVEANALKPCALLRFGSGEHVLISPRINVLIDPATAPTLIQLLETDGLEVKACVAAGNGSIVRACVELGLLRQRVAPR